MKYIVELYKHSKLVSEQTVTAPGKTECKVDYLPNLTLGAEVEIKEDEERHEFYASVKFFEGEFHWEKDFDLNEGRGAAFWDTETFRHDMQVVIRPFGT